MILLGIAYHAVLSVTSFVLEFIFCYPRHGQTFFASINGRACQRDAAKLGIAQASLNIIGDFYLFFLPIPVIWNLQYSLRKKICISAVFMTGFL